MQDKLKELEKKYCVDWREFEIKDLFRVSTSKSIDKGKLNFTNSGIQFIGRTTTNNGVQGNIKKQNFEPNPKNTFSVSQIGVINAQFREKEWYASQNMFVLTAKQENQNLVENFKYITTAINKGLTLFSGGYSSYPTQKTLEKLKITLPTVNNEIAFDYIKEFVNTLEAERLATLEAYLLATGLKNTELTLEERSALDKLGGAGSVSWKVFSLPSLFTIKNTHCILSRDIVENSGTVPYLTAGQGNNAVGTYVKFDESQIDEGNSIFIGGKTFVVTYQEKDYFSNDSHNLALYYKDASKRTKENQLFMTTAVYKSLSHLYSWGNSISRSKIQSDSVMLPCDDEGKIDFDFMSTLVSAVQKVVIKNVVTHLDKRIALTSKVIKEFR